MGIEEPAESASTASGRAPRWRLILRLTLVLAICVGLGLIAYRAYRSNQATNAAIAELSRLSSNATLVDAVISQNAGTFRLKQAEIDEIDRRYKDDFKSQTGLALDLMTRPASQMLKDYADGAQDRIVLIMVMDARGLNVADSRLTHDYWQGDEEKFTKTFPLGAGAVHWGDPERDDVTGRVMRMVARTLTDPKTGEPIGAIAIGYDFMTLSR